MNVRLALLGLLLVAFSSATIAAQDGMTRTYRFDDIPVQLAESDREIVIYPTQDPKTFEQAADVARTFLHRQEDVTNTSVSETFIENAVAADSLVTLPSTRGLPAGAVIVPRLSGLGADKLSDLTSEAGSAMPVFLIEGKRVVPLNSVTFKLKEGADRAIVGQIIEHFGLQQEEIENAGDGIVRLRRMAASNDDVFSIGETLQGMEQIEWAEPDLAFEASLCAETVLEAAPNDSLLSQQWYLESLQARKLWERSTGKDNIIVAVLDDGVDLRHEDLLGNLLPGRDFFELDDDPSPHERDAHGTACAGLIGGVGNNNKGIAGLSWKCKILPVRISGPADFATVPGIADAIRYSRAQGAKVISCSWGGGFPSAQIHQAIKDVTASNECLVVAASGNATPARSCVYPARFPECIAVGSLTREDRRFNYSCYGPEFEVDIMSPSGDVRMQGDIVTTDHSGDKGYNRGDAFDAAGNYTSKFGGTSAATPIVAGVIANVWSGNPQVKASDIRKALEQSAEKVHPQFAQYQESGDNVGRSKQYGYGKIHPLDFLKKFQQLMAAAPYGAADSIAFTSLGERSVAEAETSPSPAITKQQPGQDAGPVEDDQGSQAAKLHSFYERPASVKFKSDGFEAILKPDLKWAVIVFVEKEPQEADWSAFLRHDELRKEARRVGPSAFLVSREALKDEKTLMVAASEKGLPGVLLHAYQDAQGAPVAPLGTITMRAESEQAKRELMQLFEQKKLPVRGGFDNLIRVQFMPETLFSDPSRALDAIRASGHTEWAELDVSFRLNKF